MNPLDDFLVRAALAGLGVAVAAGPLGCFMVWRRMAFLGDATAHAAILGVAFALATSLPVYLGVLLVAFAMAGALTVLDRRRVGPDATLAVLAHSALGAGLFAVALMQGVRVDLNAFLFGDLLAVSTADLALIWGGAALVCGALVWRWTALLTATLNDDLARAAGLDPRREQAVLTIATALVIAAGIKVVGALLITALLIIPPTTARAVSGSPERMAVASILIGSLATLLGLWLSLRLDTPTGPSIVCAAAGLYVAAQLFGSALRR